ncbi:MAG: exosome complex protein Rrp42 [Nanoarchaeota archaeon]
METLNISVKKTISLATKGMRIDGRKALEFRKIEIETGISKNAEGSARVRVGQTEVVAGVKMDVGEPYPDSPDAGNLIVSLELTPLSSSRYDLGPPGIGAIEIARLVDRAVRESKLIDIKKLCIKEGEKVWNVYIDIYSINDAGNVLDAAAIAAVAALQTAFMPKYDEKKEKVDYHERSDKKVPLNDLPVMITFHKIGNTIMIDPSVDEEESSSARLTLAMTEHKGKIKIHSMQKGKEDTLSIEEFSEILKNAESLFKEMQKKL